MQAHKLTSSQAHKLASSQASKTRLQAVFAMSLGLAMVSLALSCGCQRHTSAATAGSGKSSGRLAFDAGVILAGESSYLCIPFERLALTSTARIASVETSCECVRGSVVSYLAANQSTAQAVRLDFVPEIRSANSKFVPMPLSVQITLEIEGDQNKRDFWIELIHSEIPAVH